MIKFLGELPKDVYIAVSGGIDSMVILDFLSIPSRNIHVLHFNHETKYAKIAELLVRAHCENKNIPLSIGNIKSKKKARESQEEYWRKERYNFFSNFTDKKIITCHHLCDQVENYLFTMLNGKEMLIPYSRDNFIRPFLVTKKKSLIDWANNKNVSYASDPSNKNTKFMRNFIRHELLPMAKVVNPGLEKIVFKKTLKNFNLKK